MVDLQSTVFNRTIQLNLLVIPRLPLVNKYSDGE